MSSPGVFLAACVLAVAVVLPPSVGGTPTTSFTTMPSVPVHLHISRSVWAADMDGDGHQDMVIASALDNRIAWYRNNGQGDFLIDPAPISLDARAAYSVFCADVNGDGFVDVLSASEGDNKIAWYRNDGKGSFTTMPAISTSVPGASVVFVADLNADGYPDVLAGSTTGSTISWYMNDGVGNFTTMPSISTAAGVVRSLFVADLNGDRHPDVVSANENEQKIMWFLNDGLGNFTTMPTISSSVGGAYAVFAVDLDGDGHTDVACAGHLSQALWFRNLGNGTFVTMAPISSAVEGYNSLFAADLNGDSHLDLVFASGTKHTIAWYLNDGRGNFTTMPAISTTAMVALSVFCADLNGDGYLDVLSSAQNEVTWYRNDVPQRFSSLQQIGTGPNPSTVLTGDWNGDGLLDVMVSYWPGALVSYRNTGHGNFATMQTISTGDSGVSDLFTADLNSDGHLDILAASEFHSFVRWYRNDGNGTFTAMPVMNTASSFAHGVFAADLNGDGFVDVISAMTNGNMIEWHRNDGTGSFTTMPPITTNALAAYSSFAADLDGDGDLDVLSASANDNKIAWYRNDGLGNFTTMPVISTSAYGARRVRAADMNGDGHLDVVSVSPYDNTVSWYRNNGSGTFTTMPAISTSVLLVDSLFLSDLDGDGFVDVLAAGNTNAEDKFEWFRNDGQGNFTTMAAISTTDGVSAVCAADLDGDGRVDVVASSIRKGQLEWFRNIGVTPSVSVSLTDWMSTSSLTSPSLALPGPIPWSTAVQPVLNPMSLRGAPRLVNLTSSAPEVTLYKQWTVSVAPMATFMLFVQLPHSGLTLRCCVPASEHCVHIVSPVTLRTHGTLRLLPCSGSPQPLAQQQSRQALLALLRRSALFVVRMRLKGPAKCGLRCASVPPGVHVPVWTKDPTGAVLVLAFSGPSAHRAATVHTGTSFGVTDPGTLAPTPLAVVSGWTGSGGAVLLQDTAFLHLRRWVISNCSTSEDSAGGCGALAVQNSSVFLAHSALQHNTASTGNGGAMSVRGQQSQLLLYDTTLSHNAALSGCGGSLYMDVSTSLLHADNVTFAHSSAQRGGALCMEGEQAMVLSSTFHGNRATAADGGSIRIGRRSNFTLLASTLWSSNALTGGGAIASYGDTRVATSTMRHHAASVGGAIFCDSCSLSLLDSVLEDNAAERGGALFANVPLVHWNYSSAVNNRALQGGAMWCRGTALSVSQRLVLHGGSITGNVALQGGALWSSNCGISLQADVTLSNNSATTDANPTLLAALQSATSNTAELVQQSSAGVGGALFATGRLLVDSLNFTILECTNATIHSNTASLHGGGVATFGRGAADLQRCSIRNNTAFGRGGGVFFQQRVPLVSAMSLIGNTAPNDTTSADMGGAPATLASVTSLPPTPQPSGQPPPTHVQLELRDVTGSRVGYDSFSAVQLLASSSGSGCISSTKGTPVRGLVTIPRDSVQLWGPPNASCQYEWTSDVAWWQPASVDAGRFTIPSPTLSVVFSLCTSGQFWLESASSCTDCALGKFQPAMAHALPACIDCPAGSVGNTTGRSSCAACLPGTVSPAAATQCFECSAGRHQATSSLCADCLSGFAAVAPQRTACTGCGAGTFSQLPASVGCSPCPAGRFSVGPNASQCTDCPAGLFQPDQSQSFCWSCPQGAISSRGSSRCTACSAGRFEHGTSCQDCQPGRASAYGNSSECAVCPLGRFSSLPASVACSPCDRGKFANATALAACLECPAGRVQNAEGAQQCIECVPPSFMRATGERFCDFCPVGQFYQTSTDACEPCPEGTVCVLGNLTVQPGHWTTWDPDKGELESYECLPDLCEGNGECAAGRKPFASNPLCADCEDGFSQWHIQCVACDSTNWRVVIPVVLVALLFVIVLLKTSQSSSGAMASFMYFAQMSYLFLRRESSFAVTFGVFNLDPSDSAGTTCVFPIEESHRMVLGLVFPALSFGFLVLLAITHWLLSLTLWKQYQQPNARGGPPRAIPNIPKEMDPYAARTRSPFTRTFHWTIYLRTMVAIYVYSFSAVTTTVFEILNCQELAHGLKRVRAYPAVDCRSAQWRRFALLSYVLVVVYCFAVPVVTLAALLRAKSRRGNAGLRDPKGVRAVLGVLYEPYRPIAFVWGLYGLFRRAALVCSWVFLADKRGTQLATVSLLNGAFVLLQVVIQPFGTRGANYMQTLAVVTLCVITVALPMTSSPFTPFQDAVFALLTLAVGFALACDVAHKQVLKLARRCGWVRINAAAAAFNSRPDRMSLGAYLPQPSQSPPSSQRTVQLTAVPEPLHSQLPNGTAEQEEDAADVHVPAHSSSVSSMASSNTGTTALFRRASRPGLLSTDHEIQVESDE